MIGLGMLMGIAVLNLGIAMLLLCRIGSNRDGCRLALDMIKSAMLLIAVAALLRIW
jgi:hypothetical protein